MQTLLGMDYNFQAYGKRDRAGALSLCLEEPDRCVRVGKMTFPLPQVSGIAKEFVLNYCVVNCVVSSTDTRLCVFLHNIRRQHCA